MYHCIACGGRLNWQADYNPDELGYEGEGVVNVCHCPKCELLYDVVCVDESVMVVIHENNE